MAITIPETEPLEFYSGETVNFNDVIIGQWGGTDVLVDPYTGSYGDRVGSLTRSM